MYVSNNPVRFVDPTGHAECDATAGTYCNGGITNGVPASRVTTPLLGIFGAATAFIGALVGGGGQTVHSEDSDVEGAEDDLVFTPHAWDAMIDGGLSEEDVIDVVTTNRPFNYCHDGKWKKGYYDPNAEVFVAVDGNTIITVIENVTRAYIQRLKKNKDDCQGGPPAAWG